MFCIMVQMPKSVKVKYKSLVLSTPIQTSPKQFTVMLILKLVLEHELLVVTVKCLSN